MAPRQPPAAAGQQSAVGSAFVQAAQAVLEMQRNAEDNLRAAAAGNADWQSYRQAAESESNDHTALGRPIPLLLLGFGAANGRRSLATELVRQIIATRQLISQEFGVYFPVLGIADHAGSFSPHKRMPYTFAIQAGISDAGMMCVAVEQAEQGVSLRGNGYSNTKEVVDIAGQRGCLILDLAEDKKGQLKSLPGLLLGGERGYYAVVIGKRSEAASAAIARAYPAERLLRLGGADLDAAAAAAAAQAEGGPAADPLQRRALGLLRRIAAWYVDRPQVQQEFAQADAVQQRFGSRPERRREAERMAAELAAQPGAPLCPCGCGQRADYHMWIGTVLLASNASRFKGEAGDHHRRRLLAQGLAEELIIAQGSKDVHTRDAACSAAAGLEAHGAWQRCCFHCRQPEPAGPEGPGHLRVCDGCKSRLFCGKGCLNAAWPRHKRECKQLAAL